MGLKRFICIIAAVLLLISCTREVEVIVEVPVPDEKESTVQFTLYTSSFSSRALQDHHSTLPLEEERRIFNYAILIFNIYDELEAALTATPYNPMIPGSTGLDIDEDDPLSFIDEDGEEQKITLTAGQKKTICIGECTSTVMGRLDENDS